MSFKLLSWMHPLDSSTPYLIGVSGGRDSIALLHYLRNHEPKLPLIVCHLNHQLRGKDSDEDSQFVKQIAQHYQFPCEVQSLPITNLAKQKRQSIELTARNQRYQFFKECAQKHQSSNLILAHHADDLVETLLFNLLRGSYGLRGMQAFSQKTIQDYPINIHRPFLEWKRTKINAYIADYQIDFREDSSNAEPFTPRNRLRNEVIPLLEDIMKRPITDAVIRAAQAQESMQTGLLKTIDFTSYLDPQGRIYLPKLKNESLEIQRLILHNYLKSYPINNLSYPLIERCCNLITSSQPAKYNLPGNYYLRRKEQRLFLEKAT